MTDYKRLSRTQTMMKKGILRRSFDMSSPRLEKLSSENESIISEIESDDDEEEDAFISIGLDLGTTYSGLAWALSTSPKDINIVKNWESDLPTSFDQHKVPSVLTYNSKGEVCSWGYKLDEYRYHISWFKLCLSPNGMQRLAIDQPQRYKELQKYLVAFKKQPVDVAADYLRCIWNHAVENIQVNIGKHLWENLKIKIVVTVPAIWDHATQEVTRKAAEMAGLLARSSTTLELIGEPEAAALAVFDEMSVQKKRALQVGDSFVVCDAGGGTVDLISYTIENADPLKLAMATESTGGLCGAVFLDGAFEKQVRTMISSEDYANLSVRSKRKMMHNWEYGIKRGFRIDADERKKWYVDIPGYLGVQISDTQSINSLNGLSPYTSESLMVDRPFSSLRISSPLSFDPDARPSARADPGTLVLKTGHLDAIFSEVCSKTKDLVGEQLSVVASMKGKEPKAILLVGGFGENIYLRQELERSFGHLEVQQPTKAWAAICRGAVLKGLNRELVVNHISKYNYGVVFEPKFDPLRHTDEDRRWDGIRELEVAREQMQWFLHRGENVEKENSVTHDFLFPVNDASVLKTPFLFRIFYSDSIKAETKKQQGVEKLCILQMTVDPSKWKDLKIHVNKKGNEWRSVDCTLEMRISSGQVVWTAKHQGEAAGVIRTVVGYEGK